MLTPVHHSVKTTRWVLSFLLLKLLANDTFVNAGDSLSHRVKHHDAPVGGVFVLFWLFESLFEIKQWMSSRFLLCDNVSPCFDRCKISEQLVLQSVTWILYQVDR